MPRFVKPCFFGIIHWILELSTVALNTQHRKQCSYYNVYAQHRTPKLESWVLEHVLLCPL